MEKLEDTVAYLKNNKINFQSLSIEEQMKIKENRCKPDIDLQQKDGGMIKKFNRIWYEQYPWLTGSSCVNKLFCFVCTIYGGDSAWSHDGIDIIKNFNNKAEKHQGSKKHIQNMEQFTNIGKKRNTYEDITFAQITRENEEKQMNNIKLEIINIFVCLLKQSRNNNKDLNDKNGMMILEKIIMKKYTCPSTIDQINNLYIGVCGSLMNCLENRLLEKIKKEIRETEFCSIQTDEIYGQNGSYSVIIRYIHKGNIKERFVGFHEIGKAFDMAQIINTVIGDARKLICHSYDGSSSMKHIRQGIKSIIPKILFVPNHFHKLNIILLHNLQNVKECKLFVDKVAFICVFFRNEKCRTTLKREGVTLHCLNKAETLWEFDSKSVSTIIKNYAKMVKVTNELIMKDPSIKNVEMINNARCVQNILKCPLFVLLCCLFNKIFVYADHLANVIQKKLNLHVETCLQEITRTVKNISNFKTDIIMRHCIDETRTHMKISEIPVETVAIFKYSAFMIIDGVVQEIDERYKDVKIFKFVELLESSKFTLHKNRFPKKVLQELVDHFSDIFDTQRLENELTLIYRDPHKRLSPYKLFSYLYDNDLIEAYKETFKLLKLYLTYPILNLDASNDFGPLYEIRQFLSLPEDEKRFKSSLLYVNDFSNPFDEYRIFKESVISSMNVEPNC